MKFPLTDLLILKGPGYFDGHAMRIGNQVYTFIDITAYIEYLNIKKFSFDVFLFHELVHGSHYSLNLEFSPENITLSDERYLYKTIAEGIAVYLSSKIYSGRDCFWFNFINDNLSLKWLKIMKIKYENDIQSLITNNFSEEQRNNLLGMEEFTDEFIVKGRRSYYIGYKILSDYFSDKDPIEILKLKYKEIFDVILK